MLAGIVFPQKATCPVCGEVVDLSDEKTATEHMMKDDAHRNRVAEIRTEQLLDMAVGTGIMRRV